MKLHRPFVAHARLVDGCGNESIGPIYRTEKNRNLR